MTEVRRIKFYAPKKDKGKLVVKPNGKAELIPMMIRQAYIPDPVGIDGIKGYIVTVRKRDSNKRVAHAAQLLEDGKLQPDKIKQFLSPTFTVQTVREGLPKDTPIVKWATCPGGIKPRWGIALDLTPAVYHKEWFALDVDGSILGHNKDRHKLELKFHSVKVNFVYGFMEPRTISAEKRLWLHNDISPERMFIGEKKFGNWAKHFVGGYKNALQLINDLLEDTQTV